MKLAFFFLLDPLSANESGIWSLFFQGLESEITNSHSLESPICNVGYGLGAADAEEPDMGDHSLEGPFNSGPAKQDALLAAYI